MTASAHHWLVAADVGNSAVKCALYRWNTDDEPSFMAAPEATFRRHHNDSSEPTAWPAWLEQLPGERILWVVISVAPARERELARRVATHRPGDTYYRLANARIPIEVALPEPDGIGTDRLAAAVAANRYRRSGQPAIVVDAGTAITVDALDTRGTFLGGTILPGPALMANALSTGTEQLPLPDGLDLHDAPPPIGIDTMQALTSGIVWGCRGGVTEVVRQMTHQLGNRPELLVICTGGHGKQVHEFLPMQSRSLPNLVLNGVREIALRMNLRDHDSAREQP